MLPVSLNLDGESEVFSNPNNGDVLQIAGFEDPLGLDQSDAANNGPNAPPGVPKPPNPIILQEPSKGSCTDAVGEFDLE